MSSKEKTLYLLFIKAVRNWINKAQIITDAKKYHGNQPSDSINMTSLATESLTPSPSKYPDRIQAIKPAYTKDTAP